MEGGFFDELRQLEFFPGAEKQTHSCVPVSSTAQISTSDVANQGIYQDEESVDLSALLESCNSDHHSAVSQATSTAITTSRSTHSETTTVYNVVSSYECSYPNYLPSGQPHPSMYGTDGFSTHHLHSNPMDVTPNSPSMVVDHHSTASSRQHVVHIDDPSSNNFSSPNQNRPAPGKMRAKSSKKSLDKHSDEYRMKRDRNNIAVRKSREKSRIRVLDTEKRVKELEEENSQLQSKLTLLTKELNVLKSLFTSAGVSQPPNFSPKDDGVVGK